MNVLLDIYFTFFKVGLFTFGGGMAMLPILKEEVVEKKNWLKEEEVVDFYAMSQGLPGIIATNVAIFIGYTRKKTIGGIVAALGSVSPCIIIITIIAAFLSNFLDNPMVESALSAISVCVCALILKTLLDLWKKGVQDIYGFMIFLVSFILATFTSISPTIFIIISGTLGIAIQKTREIKNRKWYTYNYFMNFLK